MRTRLALISAGIIIGIGAAQPSFANDGFYVSGSINSTTQENNQTRNTESNQPLAGASGGPSGSVVDKETGIGFVGGIGYKYSFSNDFFVSTEAFYSTESAQTTIINSVLANNVELNSTYGIDLRLGHNVTDKVALYGLISATAYDFDSRLNYTFAPPVNAISATEWALTYGGGVELKLSGGLSTFGEFRIANDLSFDTPADVGGVISRNELNFTTLRTGFRFSF